MSSILCLSSADVEWYLNPNEPVGGWFLDWPSPPSRWRRAWRTSSRLLEASLLREPPLSSDALARHGAGLTPPRYGPSPAATLRVRAAAPPRPGSRRRDARGRGGPRDRRPGLFVEVRGPALDRPGQSRRRRRELVLLLARQRHLLRRQRTLARTLLPLRRLRRRRRARLRQEERLRVLGRRPRRRGGLARHGLARLHGQRTRRREQVLAVRQRRRRQQVSLRGRGLLRGGDRRPLRQGCRFSVDPRPDAAATRVAVRRRRPSAVSQGHR